MSKACWKCYREAIPCFECTVSDPEPLERLAQLEREAERNRAITEYYRDKKQSGQPPPMPRR